MKIRTMLIIAIAIYIVVISTVFSLFISGNTTKQGKGQFDNFIMSVSDKQITNVKQYFDSYTRTINNISGNYYILEYAESGGKASGKTADVVNVLNAYTTSETDIYALALLDEKDNVLLSTAEDFISPAITDALKYAPEQRFYCTNSPSDLSESVFYLYSKTKVNDNVYLICAYNSEKIQKLVSYTNFDVNGRVILIDPEATLIDIDFIGNLNDLSMPEYLEFGERLTDPNYKLPAETFSYEIGKQPRTAYMQEIGDTGWHVAALAESDRAYFYSSGVSSLMSTVSWIISLLLLALDVLIIFLFLKPLYIINETLETIKKGNFEARINIVANNEYGKIANEFNELLDNVIVSEGRYRTIVEMSDNIIFEWNFLTKEVTFSSNFNKKFSYRAPSDLFEDSFLVKCKVHPDDAKRYNCDLQLLAGGTPFKRNEYRWKNIYGDYIWVLMRTAAINDRSGAVVKIVGVIVDIDRAKKSEKILTTRASYDALTGLYNRETVEGLINNEIELLNVRKNQFAILFIDVDDFKQYNDNYSHATGDQVLKFTAVTINEAVSNFGIAGRFGGDEFVVCIRNSDVNDPAMVAQKILDKLREGFNCDGANHLTINVSIGIAIIKDSSRRVDEIIGMADDAMYRIKKSGKSNYGFIT